MADITLGGAVAAIGGAALVLAAVLKVGKPIKKVFAAIEKFMAAWNGTPAVEDGAGVVIEPAKPGVIATLEILRAQVQNSHSTNLRDDVDRVQRTVTELVQKVDEHITIAKASDERQDRTGQIVDEYLPKIQHLLGETDQPPATPPGGVSI